MSSGVSPGRPVQVRRDDDYESLRELLSPVSTWVSNASPSHSYPLIGDQPQEWDCEGMNALFLPGSTLFYDPSTSQPDLDQGCVNPLDTIYNPLDTIYNPLDTIYNPLDTIYNPLDTVCNPSTSQSDPGQGDQQHYEDVNTFFPPVSTFLYNSSTSQPDLDQGCVNPLDTIYNPSTSQSDPDQQHAPSSAHPSRARTSSTSTPTTCPTKRGYTEEQEDAILSMKKTRGTNWVEVAEAYNRRCHADGTPWEPRSAKALEKRYYQCKAVKALRSSSPTCAHLQYTKEQEDFILFLKDEREMPWAEIIKAYNLRCYPDGTPWEQRTMGALQQRYCYVKARISSTSTPTTSRAYTEEQAEDIRVLKEDRGMSWIQIGETYNGGCNADGTPRKQRTTMGVKKKYHARPSVQARRSLTSQLRYTKEQEEAIRSLKEVDRKTWCEVGEAYNLRRYADGTLWEARTPVALKKKYLERQSGIQRRYSTSTFSSLPTQLDFTEEQEETIRSFKDDCAKTWDEIEEVYNGRCYAGGTPWEQRTKDELQLGYYERQIRIMKARGPTSTSRPRNPAYTEDQEEAIRFFREVRSMSWAKIEETYNWLCDADGTPWKSRTAGALQKRYQLYQLREGDSTRAAIDLDDEA